MGQLFWQLTGVISEERMTEALTRILGLKAAKGLHKNRLETQSDEALAEALQNPEYKKIAPAISDFTKDNDLVISLLDVANGHPAFGLSKGGGEIPWYVHEIPVVGISVNKPTMLADTPMLRTYINTYDSNDDTLDALVDALMEGPDAFKGTDPIDSYCGMFDTHM